MIAKTTSGVCCSPKSLKCGVIPGGGVKAPIFAWSMEDELEAMASGIDVWVNKRKKKELNILSNQIWGSTGP